METELDLFAYKESEYDSISDLKNTIKGSSMSRELLGETTLKNCKLFDQKRLSYRRQEVMGKDTLIVTDFDEPSAQANKENFAYNKALRAQLLGDNKLTASTELGTNSKAGNVEQLQI